MEKQKSKAFEVELPVLGTLMHQARRLCFRSLAEWIEVVLPAACLILLLPIRSSAESPIVFTDVTPESGIEFVHSDGSDGRHFIIESMSAGLALLDFDNDGDLDVYFLSGAPIEGGGIEARPTNALYRNDGDLKFTDVTRQSGVGDTGFGLGVACADYDNDGYVDLYINNYRRNTFYRNNGDGTFSDITDQAGVANGKRVGGGTSFLDIDGDGDLDLYVANYIQFDARSHKVHIHKGLPSYPSPLRYEPAPDTLFRNEADGTFRDISGASGIRSVAGRSMGVATFDYDSDGDPDILVANDSQENHFFSNNGKGEFTELGLLTGLAYDFKGKAQASMGAEVSDFGGDGLFDLAVTSFSEEPATIYQNSGEGFFDDVTLRTGISPPTFAHVTWGVVAEDFDLDGKPDLLIGAGDLDDNRNRRGGSNAATGYHVPDVMLRNLGQGRFDYLEQNWGSASSVNQSTRGLIAGDLDGDGDADVIALNARSRPTVLRNDCPPKVRRLRLRLIGHASNRDAIGAVVRVADVHGTQAVCIRSGRSYQSDARGSVTLALSDDSEKTAVEVTWPGSPQPVRYVVEHPGRNPLVTLDDAQNRQ